MCGLIVPQANGSSGRGSENHPAGFAPTTLVNMSVARSSRAFSSARAQQADVLMLQAVGGDFMASGEQRANPVGAKLRDHRGNGNSGRDAEALQNSEKLIEAVMCAELRIGMRQIGGTDSIRTARHAQIHHHADTAAIAVRPANLVVPQTCFVGYRVALLPGHRIGLRITPQRASKGKSPENAWRPARMWETTLPAASSSG